MPEQLKKALRLPVVEGGKPPLSAEQRQAISAIAEVLRSLPPGQADAVVELVEEFRRDGYLERAQPYEIPVVKILAEVIHGWEPDGVYEFARAWASTLVAREDDFDWSNCRPEEKRHHLRRIEEELARRGIAFPGW